MSTNISIPLLSPSFSLKVEATLGSETAINVHQDSRYHILAIPVSTSITQKTPNIK
jgi:hypothetical protein